MCSLDHTRGLGMCGLCVTRVVPVRMSLGMTS